MSGRTNRPAGPAVDPKLSNVFHLNAEYFSPHAVHADGGSPLGLAGKNALDLRDAAGKPLVEEMISVATQKGKGVVDYVWRNLREFSARVLDDLHAPYAVRQTLGRRRATERLDDLRVKLAYPHLR